MARPSGGGFGYAAPGCAFLGILEKYRFLQYGPAKVAGAEETDR